MVEIEELYRVYLKHPLICTDTRKIEKGCLFFALRGDHFNGNEFAPQALKKGAAYAVADDPDMADQERMLKVPHVLESMQQLAKHHRKQTGIPVVGITGSNGKTTTKELMHAALSAKYNVLATSGNFNNHIGVPLTLLRLTSAHQLAIVEMGANHIGEIGFLSELCLPDVGLITNIGKAHLKGFGSYEGVIRAKTELYKHIRKHHGKLYVNADDPVLMKASEGMKRGTYGLQQGELRGNARLNAQGQVGLDFHWEGKEYNIDSRLFGIYNAANILAALRVGIHFEVPVDKLVRAIETYEPRNNRSQLMETESNRIILDAYNANPSSMQAALKSFEAMDHPRKTVILGDMLELGAESGPEHILIDQMVGKMNLEDRYLVGKEFSAVASDNHKVFQDVEELNDFLTRQPLRDQLILIKGSRGIQLEKCLDFIP